MFISKRADQLSMIRHDDHMAQTAVMADNWSSDWFESETERRDFIRAMAVHDAGWTAADDEVLYDAQSRRPLNFMHVDLRRHIDFYRSGYERALGESGAAGLLVGMHWIGLYTSRFGAEPEFIYRVSDEQAELKRNTILDNQKEWIDVKERLWVPTTKRATFEDRIWKQYEAFQLLDRLSIALCMGDIAERRSLSLGEIRFKGRADYVSPEIRVNGDGTIAIGPFPFATEFAAPISRRWIPDEDYHTHEELAEAVRAAPVESLVCRIVAL